MSTSAVRYSPSYTVADYELWEGDWELWNGVAVCMLPSPTYEHQSTAARLLIEITTQLRKNAQCHCEVVAGLDWKISQSTIVRPDISVLCSGHPGDFISYAPSIIVEILSPSTEHKDRTAKKDLYQQQDVRYYLIADPTRKVIEVNELIDGTYIDQPLNKGIVSLAIDSDCSAEFAASDVFVM